MKNFWLIIFIILDLKILSAQILSQSSNLINKTSFQKIEIENRSQVNSDSINFYPLSDRDFWEYIVTDTTKFIDFYEGLKYSVVKEVIGDTTMSNGHTYRIIKWEKCANSVNEPPSYEYVRKSSESKIYIYSDNQEYLLYDFSLNEGSDYPSQYPGYRWAVSNKYNVIGYGDTLSAIDFELIDQSYNTKRTETVIEKFGLTYFTGDINGYSNVPEGSFFGGIIQDSTYGYLLARRQEIDWSEFYPLHIGDFWKYEGYEGYFETLTMVRVIEDTIMTDSNIYKMIEYEKIGGPYPGKGIYYERIDSAGNVLSWDFSNSTSIRKHKFISCLGDTFSVGFSYFRLDNKNYGNLHYFMYPDLIFYGLDFTRGFGLTQSTIEGGMDILVGAVINGQVFGDTSVTKIDEEYDNIPVDFKLNQNYPNPFNSSTTIKYTIPKYSYVSLKVFDLLGREIQTLVDEEKPAGEYSVSFIAVNLSSGVYIYTIKANDFFSSKKMILAK